MNPTFATRIAAAVGLLPDFSSWKDCDALEAAFARLGKDLRSAISQETT